MSGGTEHQSFLRCRTQDACGVGHAGLAFRESADGEEAAAGLLSLQPGTPDLCPPEPARTARRALSPSNAGGRQRKRGASDPTPADAGPEQRV